MTPLPRSVRNANPGNIERGSATWAGLLPFDQMDSDQRGEQRFCVFVNAKYGFRALAVLLRTYKLKHECDTVRKIIKRFAPPNENATDAYVKAVSQGTGFDPDKVLDFDDPATLIALSRAIATHEAGGWFFEPADLAAGVDLALYPSVKGVAQPDRPAPPPLVA